MVQRNMCLCDRHNTVSEHVCLYLSQCAVDLFEVALCLAKDLVAPWSKPLKDTIDTISTVYGLMKVRSSGPYGKTSHRAYIYVWVEGSLARLNPNPTTNSTTSRYMPLLGHVRARSVGRSLGQSVGRSVGRLVGWSVGWFCSLQSRTH